MNKMSNAWWNKKYGKDSICAITQTRLRPGRNKYGQKRSIFLGCHHGFNRVALQDWIVSSIEPTCPLCRKEFDPIIAFIAKR